MWSAPHIEGQFLRDEISRIILSQKDDWFPAVYDLLQRHEVPSDRRHQLYRHAQAVENTLSKDIT